MFAAKRNLPLGMLSGHDFVGYIRYAFCNFECILDIQEPNHLTAADRFFSLRFFFGAVSGHRLFPYNRCTHSIYKYTCGPACGLGDGAWVGGALLAESNLLA